MKEECPVWSLSLLLERVDVRLSTHASTYLSAFLVVYRAPSLAPAHLTGARLTLPTRSPPLLTASNFVKLHLV